MNENWTIYEVTLSSLPATKSRASSQVEPAEPMPEQSSRAKEKVDPICPLPGSAQRGEEVHNPRESQNGPDDLALLHAMIGHYARLLWDMQKTRVAMGNRVSAMERDDIDKEWRLPAEKIVKDLKAVESGVNRQLESLMKRHPLREWIERTPGIGLGGIARVLGVTGSLDNFPNVAKLWAYLGMHVVNGAAPKRKRGEKANWSADGRKVCYQLADAIVKQRNSPYRAFYDAKKAEYLGRERAGASECPFGQVHKNKEGKVIKCGLAHAHNAAMRYAVKEMLKEMWVEWRRRK